MSKTLRCTDVKNASLGGLLATALAVKGVKGFVTSGRCRDLAELRALEFPVSPAGIPLRCDSRRFSSTLLLGFPS
jgi:regulator of RNase E activity RraA